jgi:asparagine synthase (glutamine-hydrolysing)
MSVQFGRWNFGGRPLPPEEIEAVQRMMAGYGAGAGRTFGDLGISIVHQPFCTSRDSHREVQPYVASSGKVFVWDGRLDNRATYLELLTDRLAPNSPDVSIVAAAYERWGTGCLAQLVGDWALSVWDPKERFLILAKDPIGVRPLFYAFDADQTTWSSVLDPLIFCSTRSLSLEEEYLAGYLSSFPAAHLTPYAGIRSVPPSSFVRLRPGNEIVAKYWNPNPEKTIRYQTDHEYEEHFRLLFRESVRRRLRSSTPVLAELSGGIDSCSIVCVADRIFAEGIADCPSLDTLSYFDDAEPNWNEKPYFTMVEQLRGRSGYHIDLACDRDVSLEIDDDSFQPIPGKRVGSIPSAEHRARCIRTKGYRVVLSGIGGDEVTGGVPTPIPEIANLLARPQLRRLCSTVKAWALVQRKPWFHILAEAIARFFPRIEGNASSTRPRADWISADFLRRHRRALHGYDSRLKIFGPLPSFQENLATLDALRRQISCDSLPSNPAYEKRYPYLDRDFLEFLFAVPREQLVRPGMRRSLMRRALAGLVPDEILNRKRKAFVARAPHLALLENWHTIAANRIPTAGGRLGIVNDSAFTNAIESAREGREIPIVTLMRTLELETWLRSLLRAGSTKRMGSARTGHLYDREQRSVSTRATKSIDFSAEKI